MSTYRNRHDRLESHFGDLWATLVELSSGLDGQLTEGTSLEVALQTLHDRILRLEDADQAFGSFKGDAFIAYRFYGDAIIKAEATGAFTGDAELA